MSYYKDGYRNGHLDRYMGNPPSIISLTWPDYSLPEYARGYADGYYSNPKLKEKLEREEL